MTTLKQFFESSNKSLLIFNELTPQTQNKEVIKFFIFNKIDLNVTDAKGNTPLINAVRLGNVNIVKLLLSNSPKCDINHSNNSGNTALMYSASLKDDEIFNLLVQSGAEIKTKNINKETCLIIAAFYSNIEVVKKTLISPSQQELSKSFLLCCKKNNIEVFKLIVEKTQGFILPLEFGFKTALKENSQDVVEFMLEKYVFIGHSEFFYSCYDNNNLSLFKILTERYFLDNLIVNVLFLESLKENKQEFIEYFLKRNDYNVDFMSECENFLLCAVKNNLEDVVEVLLQKKKDHNLLHEIPRKDLIRARYPLCEACEKGNEKIVRMLLECGADVNIKDCNYNTPLIIAVKNNNENLVKLLVEKSANKRIKNLRSETALMKAIKNKNRKIVEILLKGENESFKIPFKFLLKNYDEEIFHMILKHHGKLTGGDIVYFCYNIENKNMEIF